MKLLFCRLHPRVQAYVFLLGVAAVTPTAAVAARFSGVLEDGRLLQASAALRVHFAAREVLLVESSPPASLLSKLPTAAAAEAAIDFRRADPLSADGEMPTASTAGQGAAPFSPKQMRALAEDLSAVLRLTSAAPAGGDRLTHGIAPGRFYMRLEQLRKLLETLRYLVSHAGAVDTRFGSVPAEARLLQASTALRVHFAAREPSPWGSLSPASLLLQTLAASVTEAGIDFHQGDPLTVDGETSTAAVVEQGAASAAPVEAPGTALFSLEQIRALAEDLSAALHSAPAASAGGDRLTHGIAPGRFYMRLEQLRKLLETLRHLRPPHIGAGYTQYARLDIAVSCLRPLHIRAFDTQFSGVSTEDCLSQARPALRIHFAAREYPPAASPHPASLLLQPLTAVAAGVATDFRHGDPLAADGETSTAAVAEQGAVSAASAEAPDAAPFSPERVRALAEDLSAALCSASVASAGGDNPAYDIGLRRFYMRLEQLRKLLETLRHLTPPHIGAADTWFGGVPVEDRLSQARPALRTHFATREYPPAASPHPASLLLQPLTAAAAGTVTSFHHGDPLVADGETSTAAVAEQGAASAAPAEAPGAAPFSPKQNRTLAEDLSAALRSVHAGPAGGDNPTCDIAPGRFYARLRCAVAGLIQSAELSLTIHGAAS